MSEPQRRPLRLNPNMLLKPIQEEQKAVQNERSAADEASWVKAADLMAPGIVRVVHDAQLNAGEVISGLLLWVASYAQNLTTPDGKTQSIGRLNFLAAAAASFDKATTFVDEPADVVDLNEVEPVPAEAGLKLLKVYWRGELPNRGTTIKCALVDLEAVGMPSPGETVQIGDQSAYEVVMVDQLVLWDDVMSAPWTEAEVDSQPDPALRRVILNFGPYHRRADDTKAASWRLVTVKALTRKKGV